jgi:hypothetical protein
MPSTAATTVAHTATSTERNSGSQSTRRHRRRRRDARRDDRPLPLQQRRTRDAPGALAPEEESIVGVVDVERGRVERVDAEDAVDLGLLGAKLGAQRLEQRMLVGHDDHLDGRRRRDLGDRRHLTRRLVVAARTVVAVGGDAVALGEQVVREHLATRAARRRRRADDRQAIDATETSLDGTRRQERRRRRQRGQLGCAGRARPRVVAAFADDREADARRQHQRRVDAAILGERRRRIRRQAHPERDARAGEADLGVTDAQRAAAVERLGHDDVARVATRFVVTGDVGQDEHAVGRRLERDRVAAHDVGAEDGGDGQGLAGGAHGAIGRGIARVQIEHGRAPARAHRPRHRLDQIERDAAPRGRPRRILIEDGERRQHVDDGGARRRIPVAPQLRHERAAGALDVDRKRIAGHVVTARGEDHEKRNSSHLRGS